MADHGTRGGYASGCRCPECRRYNADYSRAYRARNRKPRRTRSDKGIARVEIVHGTASGYHYHACRCADCRKVATDANRAYRAANRDRVNAYMATYRRANPDRFAGYSAARKAAPFSEAALEYAAIIATDPCVYCGAPSEHIDHIHPIHRGGLSEWDNLAPTCALCNQRKSTRSVLAFLLAA